MRQKSNVAGEERSPGLSGPQEKGLSQEEYGAWVKSSRKPLRCERQRCHSAAFQPTIHGPINWPRKRSWKIEDKQQLKQSSQKKVVKFSEELKLTTNRWRTERLPKRNRLYVDTQSVKPQKVSSYQSKPKPIGATILHLIPACGDFPINQAS